MDDFSDKDIAQQAVMEGASAAEGGGYDSDEGILVNYSPFSYTSPAPSSLSSSSSSVLARSANTGTYSLVRSHNSSPSRTDPRENREIRSRNSSTTTSTFASSSSSHLLLSTTQTASPSFHHEQGVVVPHIALRIESPAPPSSAFNRTLFARQRSRSSIASDQIRRYTPSTKTYRPPKFGYGSQHIAVTAQRPTSAQHRALQESEDDQPGVFISGDFAFASPPVITTGPHRFEVTPPESTEAEIHLSWTSSSLNSLLPTPSSNGSSSSRSLSQRSARLLKSSRQGGDMHPVSSSPSLTAAFRHIDASNIDQRPARQAAGYQGASVDDSHYQAFHYGYGSDPGAIQHFVDTVQPSQQALGSSHQQLQLGTGNSSTGQYEYRSHPPSPHFLPSHTASPLIGGQGERNSLLPENLEHDSDYLLNQYLGGSGLYRTTSNTPSYNGSSYSYGLAGSDFGENELDFAAFGLEDSEFVDLNGGEGSGHRSYEPSDYGEHLELGLGQANFAFLQQQPPGGSYPTSQIHQHHQPQVNQTPYQTGEDMPYRDLMGGPGSLLLPLENRATHQNAQAGSSEMGSEMQGVTMEMSGMMDQTSGDSHLGQQQAFFGGLETDHAQNLIYAEPGSMGEPHATVFDDRHQFEVPQVPSSAGHVPRMVPHLFDGNGPSEFAKRMNSEASEMSFSNDSEPSSRQNSLRNKPSTNLSQHGSMAQKSHRQSMESPRPIMRGPEKRTSQSHMGGFPYPQFPGVQPNTSKPQSPPQLIIPDSPMPSAAQPQQDQQRMKAHFPPHQPALNTLVPPVNPHMPYGAYFQNMSPIGPGGPSINIVPSTPTSALKDNVRGIWEKMAMQAHSVMATQNQSNPHNGKQASEGFLASVPMAEGRRASHAGVFGETGDLDFESLLQQAAMSQDHPGAPVPGTAPAGIPVFDAPQHPVPTLPAPGHAHRQRSRSESYMTAIMPNFDIAINQEQLKMWAMMSGDAEQMATFNQMVESGDFSSAMDTSGSALGSVSGSPSSIDPKVLNPMEAQSNRSSSYVGTAHQGDHGRLHQQMSLGQFGPAVANSAPPWQTSHVMAGPEVYGANFIVTNDGRRIPFDVGYKGGSMISNQVESSMRSSIAQSDVSSDGGMGNEASMFEGAPLSPGRSRHRRGVQSEDMGRAGRWASAEGDHTANFLNAIVHPADGSLLPPGENMISHPRPPSLSHHRRASSPYARGRSASVVSSASSAGGSTSSPGPAPEKPAYRPQQQPYGNLAPPSRAPNKAVRAKVTTPATEVASKGRRTHDGQFICPVPGCGSTFTRHFNLKGHLRSHNEERPFKCTFEGCTKSFARQHDCKRHMQLHVGLKPFVCDGCQRTFARLDALSRHHKTEAGLECAIDHPLPTNPDGSLLSESKFRAEMARRAKAREGVVM